jgi:hypothetical protein
VTPATAGLTQKHAKKNLYQLNVKNLLANKVPGIIRVSSASLFGSQIGGGELNCHEITSVIKI